MELESERERVKIQDEEIKSQEKEKNESSLVAATTVTAINSYIHVIASAVAARSFSLAFLLLGDDRRGHLQHGQINPTSGR